jgi:hypothetical protein
MKSAIFCASVKSFYVLRARIDSIEGYISKTHAAGFLLIPYLPHSSL